MINSKKSTRSCVIINLTRFEILVIPHPIYRRGVDRNQRYIAENSMPGLRKPIMITGEGVSLIITENEWHRIIQATENCELMKVYRWEQKGRFRLLKKQQAIYNDRAIGAANMT